jgi:hypothetical protein
VSCPACATSWATCRSPLQAATRMRGLVSCPGLRGRAPAANCRGAHTSSSASWLSSATSTSSSSTSWRSLMSWSSSLAGEALGSERCERCERCEPPRADAGPTARGAPPPKEHSCWESGPCESGCESNCEGCRAKQVGMASGGQGGWACCRLALSSRTRNPDSRWVEKQGFVM